MNQTEQNYRLEPGHILSRIGNKKVLDWGSDETAINQESPIYRSKTKPFKDLYLIETSSINMS